MRCNVVQARWRRVWSYVVQLRCRTNEGETITANYAMMPQIIMTETDKEP
jgi:hypothetical protein